MLVGAGELEEVVDECAQAIGFLDGGVELGGGAGVESALQVLESEAQRGQG